MLWAVPGALIAGCIEQAEEIAFQDLGCESVKRFTVKDLPLVVAIDSTGRNLFEEGRAQYYRAWKNGADRRFCLRPFL